MTASLFQGERTLVPGRRAPAASSTGRAHPGGSRRRWPSRQTTVGQRTGGLLIAVACLLSCGWYVQRIARADGTVITGAVTSSGVVDLNFASSGVVATVLVHVGEHVRKGQLLATETAPDATAIGAADAAAVAADRQQLAAQTGTAASVASDRAQLARDQARLAADQEAIAQTRIVAPATGIINAVDAQPGQIAEPAGVRAYLGQGQPAPVAPPPRFSLLPQDPQVSSKSGVTGSATLPVIQLRTSGSWAVLMLVPQSSAAAVRAGLAVTVSVPAAGLTGVAGSISEVLATPVTTSDGVMYEAVVAVAGHQAAPPLAGMTANVTLDRSAS
jgi:multidrug efflux pump subunit AcrA (membrane-fusion protein)